MSSGSRTLQNVRHAELTTREGGGSFVGVLSCEVAGLELELRLGTIN